MSLKLYLDLNDPQKPSPCPVAVFAFQSLDSYRDRMTQNMNRKHEKHTVPPPFEEVTNRLTMYAASLRRVYTAGGFLSNGGGRTWASPLRGDGFPRQCEHWLGMTARRCRADGTSGTPSPTKSQRGRCKKGGQSRPPLHILSLRASPRREASALGVQTGAAIRSQRGAAALTGRRTPRAFVPLRSTAGRRPLRNRNRGAAKRADRCPPFTFHIIYDSAQRHDAL